MQRLRPAVTGARPTNPTPLFAKDHLSQLCSSFLHHHHHRSFSTTGHLHPKSGASRLASEHEGIPPYPHGPAQWYKQSNFGLYGHQRIRFGNKVSSKNEIKTRRFWRCNVKRKRLWSNALNTFVRTRITTRMLRTVDKSGGLDEYLLGDRPGRIKELGMAGWKLRWRIMQTEAVKEKFRLQREKLGLPPKEEVLLGVDGLPASAEMVAEQVQRFDDEMNEEGAEFQLGENTEGEIIEADDQAAPFMQEEGSPRSTKTA